MNNENKRRALAAAFLLPVLAMFGACSKPAAAHWAQVTKGDPCATAVSGPPPAADPPEEPQPPAACDAPTFWLDDANIDVKGGTPYVILQTRYADGRIGAIRAEANCPRRKLEPTALKEAVYRDGSLIDNRMVTMSGEDEAAVLAIACARR